jgi:hypothetical protein
MMKLLIVGLALIAFGLGLVLFTDLNPAIPFIAGITTAFVAVIRGADVTGHGSAVGDDAHGVLDPNP